MSTEENHREEMGGNAANEAELHRRANEIIRSHLHRDIENALSELLQKFSKEIHVTRVKLHQCADHWFLPLHSENLLAEHVRNPKFGFSPRHQRAFFRLGIVTIDDLIRRSEEDFLLMPNFGEISLSDLREILQKFGLSLASKQP